MLLRTELTGVMINPYSTEVSATGTRGFYSSFEIDYWMAGLVVGGIAPQLLILNADAGPYDSRFGTLFK